MRSNTGQLISYLQNEGDYFIAAHGGCGGKGNYFFSSLPTRVPIQYEMGAAGQRNVIYLSSAVNADVGLVSMFSVRSKRGKLSAFGFNPF